MPDWATGGVIWAEDYLISQANHDFAVLRPRYSDEPVTVTPDTLDFGRRPWYSVHDSSFTLSFQGDGICRILEWAFEGNNRVFRGDFTPYTWLKHGDELEFEVEFIPREVRVYYNRIWYRTENDTTQIVLTGEGYDRNEIDENSRELSLTYSLNEPYPNPFNTEVQIHFSLTRQGSVNLSIFDISGRHVRTLVNKSQEAGFYTLNWDGKNENGGKVSSGLYFLRIHCGDFWLMRKLALMQ